MAFSIKVKKELERAGRFAACELCGFQAPRLANRGLLAAHIVSEAETFDHFLKPFLFNALKLKGIKAPNGWATSEGRRARRDII